MQVNEISEAEMRKILQDDYDIQMTQTMEREVSVMCNLSKGVEEKGMAKGLTNGILASIKSLVKNMGVSVEQAMSVLEIPAILAVLCPQIPLAKAGGRSYNDKQLKNTRKVIP